MERGNSRDTEVTDRQHRLFGLAVAASLALHAVVLIVLPVLQEAQRARPAPPLVARLAAQEPPAPALPKYEPPPSPLPARQPRPAPAARAAPEPAPVAMPSERAFSVEPARKEAEPAPVVPVVPAVPATPVAPQAKAVIGPDAGTVAQFRLELMDLARRYKRYPRIAQENGWEGRVELHIAIGEDGAISSITVKKGAGRAVLDDEAQAMIRTAKSKATIPPALRGKAFVIEFPVEFFLKEEK